MASPLVETKLYVPQPRRTLVDRPRLSERVSRGSEARLTLVSAPAGFGKTTMLSAWLATAAMAGSAATAGVAGSPRRSVAWLSLEAVDREPSSFWTYVVTALQTAVPGVGAGALALLQEPRPPPIEDILTTVVNELSAVPGHVDLVLDDYHLVDGHDLHTGVAFLLDHLPPQVHLVISTRADPPLPLARLRGHGDLVEIRAADLRFTPEEVAAYLNGVMGLALTSPDMAALEGRTEGWIAALQLAALSLQGRDDVAAFIAGFAGDDRYVVDYLVEEVLQRQSQPVQDFLLSTSILERLTGPLCDAVTGRGGGRETLAALDRANLFLVPLDDRRRWYRYHHLFADVLHARLLDEHPDRVPELHRRASAWYEASGERAVAIEHALSGQDVERAAELVELAIPAARRDRQEAMVRRWLDALPDRLIRQRPVLAVSHAGSLLSTGHLDIESRLADAERWLDPTVDAVDPTGTRPAAMVVVDEAEFRRLPNQIAMYRAGKALLVGDHAGTVTHARRALDLAAVDDHLGRGGAESLLGLVSWRHGDLDAAYRWYSAGTASLERAGHLSDVVGGAVTLADIRVAQGHLGAALGIYEHGLQISTERAGPVRWGAVDMHVGLADLLCERHELEAARDHLQTGLDLGEHTGMPHNRYRWWTVRARVQEAEGDLDGALDSLLRAEQLYAWDFSPDVRPIPALRARVRIRRGKLGDVLAWAREHRVSADDELSYVREFEHLTLVRLLLARHLDHGAEGALCAGTRLLDRLLRAAESGGRTTSVVEILLLQALAHQAAQDTPRALTLLRRALVLADPEGLVRVFAGEAASIVPLLEAVGGRGVRAAQVQLVLDACGRGGGVALVESAQALGIRRGPGLVDPLSNRERDVLRLLGTDLAGPGMARELVVSMNTLRTHTRNIYAKLGVTSRRAAVTRAVELDLLPGHGDRR